MTSESMTRMWANMTPEERTERVKNCREGQIKRWVNMTPEEKIELIRKQNEAKANMTPEQKREWGRKTSESNSRRYLNPIPISLEEQQICYFCGELITIRGNGGDCLLIHSLDGNHNNWAPENKVPVHNKCHTKFHHTGKITLKETRERQSLSKLESWKNPKYRTMMSKATEGRIPWNKGLTKETDERVRRNGKKIAESKRN